MGRLTTRKGTKKDGVSAAEAYRKLCAYENEEEKENGRCERCGETPDECTCYEDEE